MSLLEVKSLSQAYGGSRILRDVSFTAEAGQVVVLLGRNGVGKSTLLRTLMGVHPALSGQVTLDGKSLDGLYTIIGEEERKIRQDPVGTGSAILQKVFGAIK